MRAPITDKHLLEMMWERFPEIMKRGAEQPAQQQEPQTHAQDRTEFEQFWVDELGESDELTYGNLGYAIRRVDVAWEAWKAGKISANQQTIMGRKVWIDWKAQALELRELVRLGGIKIAELEAALAEQPAPVQPGRNHYEDGDVFERIAASKKQPAQQEPVADSYVQTVPDKCDRIVWRGSYYHLPLKQPAQQEPVAVPITSYEHRKFVLAGREWYERFAAFHDDCQIGEQLTWQEKTIRQQGYENGWNDAQRYLKEPQATSPTPAQRKPLTDDQIVAIGRDLGLKCRLGGNPNIDFDYARAIEAAHNIKENT